MISELPGNAGLFTGRKTTTRSYKDFFMAEVEEVADEKIIKGRPTMFVKASFKEFLKDQTEDDPDEVPPEVLLTIASALLIGLTQEEQKAWVNRTTDDNRLKKLEPLNLEPLGQFTIFNRSLDDIQKNPTRNAVSRLGAHRKGGQQKEFDDAVNKVKRRPSFCAADWR
eukprot:COSAG01_NODE_8417_length_2789_cov_3.643866_2_plen_168_part_00